MRTRCRYLHIHEVFLPVAEPPSHTSLHAGSWQVHARNASLQMRSEHLFHVQMEAQEELVLKQRDIMLALTKRLSDRDEQILMLQEELDAYDAAQRKLEDALDQRTADVFALRKAALEQVRILLPMAHHAATSYACSAMCHSTGTRPHCKHDTRALKASANPCASSSLPNACAHMQMKTSPGRASDPDLQSALGAWGGPGNSGARRSSSGGSFRIAALRGTEAAAPRGTDTAGCSAQDPADANAAVVCNASPAQSQSGSCCSGPGAITTCLAPWVSLTPVRA